MSRADYDRQGPKSETRISAAPQHGEWWVAFVEQSVDEATRPAMVTRGSSLEARWEPTPRTLGSSASNQDPPEGDESPDPALPRRYSAADALELGSQDRRGTGLFKQGRLQDTRSNSLVATSGEVCSAHYDARPIRPEQQEWPNRDLRGASEYFGRRQQQQQHTMFVDVGGQDANPGSSGKAGGHLSSTLASPTGSSSRRDMYSVVSGPAENERGVQKRESMEIEIPPGSIAVAAAAAEAITGIGTADYRSDHMDLKSPPSPVLRSELGEPGYYSEKDLRKLYWVWRTREEEEKRLSQQSQQSDRDDVSMEGADEGDAHDSGGANDAWTESQRENWHLRDGPGLRHSSQEGEDGGGTPNKGKSRKVEKASKYEDDVARRERGCKGTEPKEWHVEDEENEDEDEEEEEGEGDDDEEEGDDGSSESEDGYDDGGLEDGSTGKPGAEGSEDGKNAVSRRTRTQTGRKDQPRGHSEISSGATSRAGASGSSDDLRRTRAKDDKKHGCDECQKRFSRPSQLRTHQLTHSGEKPHQCHLCDKHFNVASNLKRHIRTHDKLPRKNSRDGSGVFRGFTQGFQAKQNASLKASSMEASRKARSSKSSHGSSVVTSKRPAGSTQPLERLRWMSTETPESSKMAASKQAKIAAIKQRTSEQGASSSKSRSTISPSEAPAVAHAQPAAPASTPSVAASVVHSSPGRDSIAARDHPPQPLPPPTPRPSRESDSESTLVDGTQASDRDEDMENDEHGLNNSDITHNG
ncbi:hypothetical protein BGZ72_009583 [Mortierella alpina]|nr:hypothetical protein BGZ72_009583 [Mortierella alpina]